MKLKLKFDREGHAFLVPPALTELIDLQEYYSQMYKNIEMACIFYLDVLEAAENNSIDFKSVRIV